jgi:aminopeptidase N
MITHHTFLRATRALLAAFSLIAASAHAQTSGYPRPAHFDQTPGALSKNVLPLSVAVHFDLDPYREAFSGESRYELELRAPTNTILMHARELNIAEARIDGISGPINVSVRKEDDTITLTLPSAISHRATLRLRFSGTIDESGEGLYRVNIPSEKAEKQKMLATQMEPIGARKMLPLFDEPAFRSKFSVSVTTASKFTVLSNMPVAKTQNLDGARTRTEFQETPSMSSYLLALAVGEFEKISDTHKGIALNIYTVPGKSANTATAMQWTKSILTYFDDYFGIGYTLPKLDQIAIPGKRGAMENWGLITYGENLLVLDPKTTSSDSRYWSFNIIAHEIAHQWFGNLVTMAWWDTLWLNESFASWMAVKTTMALMPKMNAELRNVSEREGAMGADVLKSVKPIERPVVRDAAAFASFDSISYNKGQAVLNMIEAYVGERNWRDGIEAYMRHYQYSNTVSDDLWRAIEAAAPGKDVRGFAESWTKQPGFPLVDVSVKCEAGKQTVRLAQSRYLLRAGYAPQQTWKVAVVVGDAAGNKKQAVFLDLRAQELAAGACGDAVLADLGANGYFRVRYDDAAFPAIARAFPKMNAPDQQRLLTDSWALAEADLSAPKRTLALIAALPLDASPAAWMQVTEIYEQVFLATRNTRAYEKAKAHARQTLQPLLARIGWEAKANESADTGSLRAQLIHYLAAADDLNVVNEARKRFATRANNPDALAGDTGAGIVRAMGIHARASDVDDFAAILSAGKAGGLSWALGRALTDARDPAVAKKVLALALSDTLPRSTSNRIIRGVAQAGHQQLAWDFVQANLEALIKRGSGRSKPYLFSEPLANSRDNAFAAQVRARALQTLTADEMIETERVVTAVERNGWASDAVVAKWDQ